LEDEVETLLAVEDPPAPVAVGVELAEELLLLAEAAVKFSGLR